MATASSRGAYQVGDESRLAFPCLPIDIDFKRRNLRELAKAA